MEAALTIDALAEDRAVVRRLLSEALADPELSGRLATLDPQPLAEHAASLPEPEQRQTLGLLARELGANRATRDQREAIVEQLVLHADEVRGAALTDLHTALEATHVRDDFWLYEPLGAADPRLLPRSAGEHALKWLSASKRQGDAQSMLMGDRIQHHCTPLRMRPSELGGGRRGPQEAPFSVLMYTAADGGLNGLEPELLAMLDELVAAAGESGLALLGVAEFAGELANALRGAANDEIVMFVTGLSSRLFAALRAAAPDKFIALKSFGDVLDVAGATGRDAAETVLDAAALSGREVTDFCVAISDAVPASLQPRLRERLLALRDRQITRGKWDTSWDEEPMTPDEVAAPSGAWIAVGLDVVDRARLARDVLADPHDLVQAVNDWAASDPGNQEQLLHAVEHLDDLRGATASGVEALEPEDPSQADPAVYESSLVVTAYVANRLGDPDADPAYEVIGEEHELKEVARTAITLRLRRQAADWTVSAEVFAITWQP